MIAFCFATFHHALNSSVTFKVTFSFFPGIEITILSSIFRRSHSKKKALLLKAPHRWSKLHLSFLVKHQKLTRSTAAHRLRKSASAHHLVCRTHCRLPYPYHSHQSTPYCFACRRSGARLRPNSCRTRGGFCGLSFLSLFPSRRGGLGAPARIGVLMAFCLEDLGGKI